MFHEYYRTSQTTIPEDASGSASKNSSPCPIYSIVAHSKGFACCGGTGTVHLFEKTDDKEFFFKARLVKVCESSKLYLAVWKAT